MSDDGGSPESEASDGGSHHSEGHSVPKEEPLQLPTPKGEDTIPDLGVHWHRQPALPSEHQRLVPPHSMDKRRLGTSPTRDTRTDSPRRCFWSVRAGSTQLRVKRRTGGVNAFISARAEWTSGACGTGGGGGVDESGVGCRTVCPGTCLRCRGNFPPPGASAACSLAVGTAGG